ncbi:MAG: ubiA, partial [Alphaproteobacteria bacterium]|nr:ubiA [Alphaproteobacteria bacterium]
MIGFLLLPLIAAYPYMKRITWWPQAFLGLNFASGALIGWASIETTLHWPALILYLAGIAWVVAYDTVYAHMDAKDDALIGIKSTALHWGPDSKKYIGIGWAVTVILFGLALYLVQAPFLSYAMLFVAAMVLATAHGMWKPENAEFSLRFFRLQNQVGMILALAALAPVMF